MHLDQPRIAIRERSFPEILDLALLLLRRHPSRIVGWLLAGVLPAALLNHWLLVVQEDLLNELELAFESPTVFLWAYTMLSLVELPLATSLLTLFLGQALLDEQPDSRRVVREFWRSLPQLLVLQVLVRGLAAWTHLALLLLHIFWPYLNEVVLLERYPLWARRRLGTLGRVSTLHGRTDGRLAGRWLSATLIGLGMLLALAFALHFARGTLTGQWNYDRIYYSLELPLALWITLGYLTIVRYLSYLDLRIRTEGWELELVLRAEAQRLQREAA